MESLHPKTIEYHYDIGDKVFFIQNNKVVEGEIIGLIAFVYKERGIVKNKTTYEVANKTYPSGNYGNNIKVEQDNLFESKSKLLDSL